MKILLLRYSDFHGVNTIKEHIDVSKTDGMCWWAKLGKQPSSKYLQDYMSQTERICLLYKPGVLYKCKVLDVITHRPENNFPRYYKRDIFGKDIEPSVYFALSAIEEIDLSFLDNYIVCSSEKEVMYTLKKTISSFMFIQHVSAPRKPKSPPKAKRETNKRDIKKTDLKGCVYRVDGSCTNRKCINYQYECTRPNLCTRQKP